MAELVQKIQIQNEKTDNVSEISGCYGCGVCATVCPSRIIDIRLNRDGFYEPHIDSLDKCVHCKLCREVCSWLHDDLALLTGDKPMVSYAAWSLDKERRNQCSSGGIGFEIAKNLIVQGYQVCGVRYNVELGRAEHYIATTDEELIPSIGSKYIQSYTVDGFKAINLKQKYLVTGTPCQIDSFRRYIRKFRCEGNFILLDFFCHGVPSMSIWRKYVDWAKKKVGKLNYVSWRNKFTSRHDSCAMAIGGASGNEKADWHGSYQMLIRGEKGVLNSRLSQGDMFYRLFLSDGCLGKACYEHCKFKYNHSSADIRIGDLWGMAYIDNEEGVSAAIAFTEKGQEILNQCGCVLVPHPFKLVAEGQMPVAPSKPYYYEQLRQCLANPTASIEDADSIVKKAQERERLILIIKNPMASAKRFILRILKWK